MLSITIVLWTLWTEAVAILVAGVDKARGDERGEVTEKAILVALFAGLALAVGAIITMKVLQAANDVPTSAATAT